MSKSSVQRIRITSFNPKCLTHFQKTPKFAGVTNTSHFCIFRYFHITVGLIDVKIKKICVRKPSKFINLKNFSTASSALTQIQLN